MPVSVTSMRTMLRLLSTIYSLEQNSKLGKSEEDIKNESETKAVVVASWTVVRKCVLETIRMLLYDDTTTTTSSSSSSLSSSLHTIQLPQQQHSNISEKPHSSLPQLSPSSSSPSLSSRSSLHALSTLHTMMKNAAGPRSFHVNHSHAKGNSKSWTTARDIPR